MQRLSPDPSDEVSPPYVAVAATTALDHTHDLPGALPVYTEADEGTLMERILAMQALNPANFVLPLTKVEAPNIVEDRQLSEEDFKLTAATRKLQREIVDAFYGAIKNRQPEIVSDFVSKGLVSPDVTPLVHYAFPHPAQTPLLAAVRAGDASMIRLLVSLGSTVDLVGPCVVSDSPRQTADLTPLQLAAAMGRLSLVKVLREEFGADHSIVAPKGETALWLARRFKHREVVEYLPAIKAGAWLRFKSAREKEVERLQRAVHDSMMLRILWATFFRLPRFLVYSLPRGAWKRRQRIKDFCKRQITKFPDRCKRTIKAVGRGIKKLPTIIKDVSKALWKFVKAIPGALAVAATWIADGLKAVGKSITNIATRVLSALHTAFSAVADFFRTITFQDVVNGVKAVFEAVFVTFPATAWRFIAGFGDMAWKFAKKFPGYVGVAIYALGALLWWVAKWPVQAGWKVLSAIGRLFAKMYDEIVICFDPKRM